MLLDEFVETVYITARIELSTVYVKFLHSVCARFSEFLGRPAELEDLTEPNLCGFLAAYKQLGWSARATNDKRQVLLALWQEAADLTPPLLSPPNRRRVRKLPEERDPPAAWDSGQVIELVNQASRQPGYVGDVLACDWWLSLFLAVYWTSSRISAMLAVESRHYGDRGILIHKQKNKRPQWFALPESCREAIERTRPESRLLIWEHPWHPRTVWAKARRIIEAAGLPCPRTGMQLFHRLRRTTVTMLWSEDESLAQKTAGHQDRATTLRSYVDPRLIHQRSAADVLPDPLEHTATIPRLRIYGV